MRLLLLPLLLLTVLFSSSPAQASPPGKVLLVVSRHGLDAGRARPGYEFDELSQAYLVFRDNGFDVEIASPRGGPVEADDYDPAKPYNALFLGDPAAVARLAATRPLNGVKPEDYAAIFVIGGKGAMFDLPFDPVLRMLLVRHYEGGGVIGAVCHGPAAFVRLRTSDGELLVAGQPMAGFTNEEEGPPDPSHREGGATRPRPCHPRRVSLSQRFKETPYARDPRTARSPPRGRQARRRPEAHREPARQGQTHRP